MMLNKKEVAKRLKISRDTVDKFRENGILSCVVVPARPRMVVFDPRDVDWLEEHLRAHPLKRHGRAALKYRKEEEVTTTS